MTDTAPLWAQYLQTREHALRNDIAEHYLPFARSIAASVYRLRLDNSVSFDDYLQYARLGLMQSVDRFDPSRGVPFEAYAARRVRGAVLNGLGQESEVAAQRQSYIERTRERMRSLKTHSAGERLPRLVQITLSVAIGALLEADLEEPADHSATGNPYASAELAQLGRTLWVRVSELPERQRLILQQHYLGGMEFQEIAAQLQLTKGRVSQLHAQAVEALRLEMAGGSSPLDKRV